jgi:hypothetical protein
MKYIDMYPWQDNTGNWCVVKVAEGHRDIAHGVWETKDGAINYCEKHEFKVTK